VDRRAFVGTVALSLPAAEAQPAGKVSPGRSWWGNTLAGFWGMITRRSWYRSDLAEHLDEASVLAG
jgi:hypothetical protein